MLVLEREQHDERHQCEVAGDADQCAGERLQCGIERGEAHDLARGGAGEAQGGEARVAAGCCQARGRAGERGERHEQQQAREQGEHDVGGGVIGLVGGGCACGNHVLVRGERGGAAVAFVEQARDGVVGRGAPDEAVQTAEHGEEDRGGRGERKHGEHGGGVGGVGAAHTAGGAVEQAPECECAHRAPPCNGACMGMRAGAWRATCAVGVGCAAVIMPSRMCTVCEQ